MSTTFIKLFAAAVVVATMGWVSSPSHADAQVITTTTPVVSYYRPRPILRPFTWAPAVGYASSTTVAAPVVTGYTPATTSYYAPTTTYYAPATTTYYAPTTTYYAPTTTYYAPATTTYYAPATSTYVAPTTTYYAPSVVAPVRTYYPPVYRAW
jgi:hypothetical protein